MRHATLKRAVTFLVSSLFTLTANMTTASDDITVSSPAFGTALYDYFQQDYFNSLLKIKIAEKQNTLADNLDDANLLAGALYLAYGMPSYAQIKLDALLSDSNSEQLKSKINYLLGKQQYQQRNWQQANNRFNLVNPQELGMFRGEFYHAAGLTALKLGATDTAISHFSEKKVGQPWKAYGQYNIAALLFSQNNPEAVSWVDRLINSSSVSTEVYALADQARILSAHYALQQNERDNAIAALQGIQAGSHVSNDALFLLGKQYLDSKQWQSALTYWLHLTERESASVAKDNALLMLPQIYKAQNNLSAAIHHQSNALATYKDEILQLKSASEAIKSNEGLQVFLGGIQLEKLSMLKATFPVLFIDTLLASKTLQNSIKDFQELDKLKANMARWQSTTPIFTLMLETRQNAFSERQPRIEKLANEVDVSALKAQADSYKAHINEHKTNETIEAFATTDELEYLSDIEDVIAKVNNLTDNEDKAEYLERIRRIKGALIWDMTHQFDERVKTAEVRLGELNHVLEETEKRIATVNNAKFFKADEFAGYKKQIQQKTAELAKLIDTASSLQDRLLARVRNQLSDAFKTQELRLKRYIQYCQTEIATLKDTLSQRGSP